MLSNIALIYKQFLREIQGFFSFFVPGSSNSTSRKIVGFNMALRVLKRPHLLQGGLATKEPGGIMLQSVYLSCSVIPAFESPHRFATALPGLAVPIISALQIAA